ncbi:hypothetical protein F4815DRAFT_445040 [Daldinia loculata]|uniref:uncharacterized protein n=1 Tax=Daldinia loculata TaxID=103429 RepID=UPI0020C34564|nr:uncharacterized protein F4817DRAFT_319295 [Daldinia loculata]KAI1643884.1 hypothetical protein F4817DRAFT_319295 [Daldinia loculata]KAI2780802.1 hypothetical protein F4815DRAFT_445040 [Daldinia loculata]
MKFLAALTFVTAALAYGVDPADTELCTLPAYVCKPDFSGWLVCNLDSHFLDGGNCPEGTACEYINDLPYCV